MTANPTTTRSLDINKLVLRAFNLAGLMGEHQSLDEANGTLARDFLETIVDALQADGIYLRSTGFEDLLLEAGNSLYLLPETVLRVVGTAMWIDPLQNPAAADGELPVFPVGREEWQVITSKASIDRPRKYFQRVAGEQVEIRFWPIPLLAGTVRFQAHFLLGDNNDGAATVDLERPWAQYIIWELAHQLAMAKTLPLKRCQYLAGEASLKLRKCKAFASESVDIQAVVAHGRGNYGRRY